MNKSFDHKATFEFLSIVSQGMKPFTLISISYCSAVLAIYQ